MPRRPRIEPPPHLQERSKALWRDLVPSRCASPGRVAMLEAALTALDQADQARQQVARDGLSFTTRKTKMVRPHPLLAVERQARATFLRIFRTLRLDWDPDLDG